MQRFIRLRSTFLNVAGNSRHLVRKITSTELVKTVNKNGNNRLILDCKPSMCYLNQQYFSTQSNILNLGERITVTEYKQIVDSGENHLLIDVRPPEDAAAAKLDHAINLPLKHLLHEDGFKQFTQLLEDFNKDGGKVYIMCRKGIASQIAVKYLKEKMGSENMEIKDIVGGLTAWSKEIDSSIKID